MKEKRYIRRAVSGMTVKQKQKFIKDMKNKGWHWAGIQYGQYVFQQEVETKQKYHGNSF